MNLKSVILAGGIGSRTGKLAEEEPKHVLPVANKPLIDYHIENLDRFRRTVISNSPNNRQFFDNYLYNKHSEIFGLGELCLREDNVMKGPLYPVLEALFHNGMKKGDEIVLGVTGDMFGHVDMDDVIKFHNKYARPLTLVATRTYPTPNACVFEINNDKSLNSLHRLSGISKENDIINLGFYVASPGLLDEYGLKQESFKEDLVFSELAKKGALAIYELKERAVNINTPYNLLCANLGELERLCSKGVFKGNDNLDVDRKILYANSSRIESLRKKKNSVIGKYAEIGNNVELTNVIVMDGAKVDDECKLENAIVKKDVIVPKYTCVNECIVSSNGEVTNMGVYYKF